MPALTRLRICSRSRLAIAIMQVSTNSPIGVKGSNDSLRDKKPTFLAFRSSMNLRKSRVLRPKRSRAATTIRVTSPGSHHASSPRSRACSCLCRLPCPCTTQSAPSGHLPTPSVRLPRQRAPVCRWCWYACRVRSRSRDSLECGYLEQLVKVHTAQGPVVSDNSVKNAMKMKAATAGSKVHSQGR
jgi:hypothetical protein